LGFKSSAWYIVIIFSLLPTAIVYPSGDHVKYVLDDLVLIFAYDLPGSLVSHNFIEFLLHVLIKYLYLSLGLYYIDSIWSEWAFISLSNVNPIPFLYFQILI